MKLESVWPLDEDVTFLNHGSFGCCPKPVLQFQIALRERMEREPVDFFVKALEPLLDEARATLAGFVGAKVNNLVFVQNATTGVNAVLRSLEFKEGDELLVTNHEYNACRNALNYVSERCGAKIVVAEIPFPVSSAAEIIEPLLAKVTARTRLVLIDHVTSQTGTIFPLEQIIPELARRGVDVLVDGAHAPGMIPLNLDQLGAAYYTGNCHKWICAPKSVAFLHVRADLQEKIRPLVISHGANSTRKDRSRFLIEFGWMGTTDVSPALSVPKVLSFLGQQTEGGWRGLMRRNHELALGARQILCDALSAPVSCPDDFIGSMASVALPDAKPGNASTSPLYGDPAQEVLRSRYGIEVPIIPWPGGTKRLIRVSAQLYNERRDYEHLVHALQELIREGVL